MRINNSYQVTPEKPLSKRNILSPELFEKKSKQIQTKRDNINQSVMSVTMVKVLQQLTFSVHRIVSNLQAVSLIIRCSYFKYVNL